MKIPFLNPDQFGFGSSRRDILMILQRARTIQTKAERMAWLEDLLAWARSDVPISSRVIDTPNKKNSDHDQPPELTVSNSYQAVRIRFLLLTLYQQPELRLVVSTNLAKFFSETSATELFCDAGIFGDPGLLWQINSILIEKLLPATGHTQDLDQLITVLFPAESDGDWVEILSPDIIKEVIKLVELTRGPEVWSGLLQSFADAMLIIATQIAGAGTDRSMRERLPKEEISNSVFIKLQDIIRAIVIRMSHHKKVSEDDAKVLSEALQAISECQDLVAHALDHIESHGVSVNLVFRFERMALLLKRLTIMTSYLLSASQQQGHTKISRLLAELIRSNLDGHRLRRIFSGELRILSRRIVDHASDSGDQYITYDKKGYFRLFLSAGGGGVVTVGDTVLKAFITKLSLPSLIDAMANWMNYSGSFIVIQFCHFNLASKQPSMTASTLAKRMAAFATSNGGNSIVLTVRDAFRSQFIAGVGNVGFALPFSILIGMGFEKMTGQHIFSVAYALKNLDGLNPLTSLAIPFAMITGFFLWLSSVLSGVVENWFSLHQISERIVSHRQLKAAFGEKFLGFLSRFIKKNAAGLSGNIFLGFFMAFMPFFGNITGIPMDARHVTFSAATLGLSIVGLGEAMTQDYLIWGFLGVVCIGLANFSVSFFLALFVASRAQNVRRGLLYGLAKRVLREFFRTPMAFFWPPRHEADKTTSV